MSEARFSWCSNSCRFLVRAQTSLLSPPPWLVRWWVKPVWKTLPFSPMPLPKEQLRLWSRTGPPFSDPWHTSKCDRTWSHRYGYVKFYEDRSGSRGRTGNTGVEANWQTGRCSRRGRVPRVGRGALDHRSEYPG